VSFFIALNRAILALMNALQHQIERNKLIEEWAKYTAQRLQKSIEKRGIGITGSLKYSILYDLMSAAGGEIDGTKHEFNYYGKFVDMGVGKGQKIEDVKSNGDLIMMGSGSRRPKKWYSKTIYAEIAILKDLLAVKYGEDAANIIKEGLTGNLL